MKVLDYIKQLIEIWREGRVIDDIAIDPRPRDEKEKDYVYGEDIILPESGIGKRITKSPFNPLDQMRTSACGAYAAVHARMLRTKEKSFPLYWYRARTNFPGPGMFLKDVLELSARANLFDTPKNLPSVITEEYANGLPLREVFGKLPENVQYFTIRPYDADAVFSAVGNGHSPVVSFFCTLREWTFEMVPRDNVLPSTARVRHYVVALPNSVHFKNGHEWITVIDSSRQEGLYLRHVRKDFLQQRMYIGGGFVSEVKTSVTKPLALPLERCQFGQRSDQVFILQRYLISQGLLQEQHATSFYGRLTSAAVLKWQLANIKNANPAELTYMQGQWWGPLSIGAVIEKHK